MVATTTKPVTVEELWEMQSEPNRLDLIDGELYRMPGAGGRHGRISTRIGGRIDFFVAPRELGAVFGETGFRLFADRQTVLSPDVAFVRASRMPPDAELDYFLSLAPDIAVGIVSPSDYPKLVKDKLNKYFEAGTAEVWVVFPKTKSIEVHDSSGRRATLGPDDTLISEDLLPGFAVLISELFP